MKNIRSESDAVLADFLISKHDREMLKTLLSSTDEKDPPTLFYSLTHLTHNYFTLTHLLNLARICKLGFNLVIALWDMNMLSSPYFKKIELEKYRHTTYDDYIKQKKEEVLSLTTALGIENVKIYTSSEIWTRFTRHKEPPLFSQYYSTLSTIDVDEFESEKRLHYLLQLPADIFFVNYFHTLFPEDIKKPIEVAYTIPKRNKLYFMTRQSMYSEGLIGSERPLIIVSKEVPRIEIDAQMPNWDMTLGEINHLISKWQFSNDEIGALYENALGLVLSEVSFLTDDGTKIIGTKGVFSLLPKLSREEIVLSTSKNLFEYFRKVRELLRVRDEPKLDFHTVKTRKEAQQIASLLKSKNALQILALANGNRTVTEIAKETDMQLSNASQYIAKLRKAGLLSVKEKKIARTSRGIKINFEATLSN